MKSKLWMKYLVYSIQKNIHFIVQTTEIVCYYSPVFIQGLLSSSTPNVKRIFPIILHISTFLAPTSLSYCSALSWSGSIDTFTLSHQILRGVQSLCHRRNEQWHLIVFWCSYPCKEKDTRAKFTITWKWKLEAQNNYWLY